MIQLTLLPVDTLQPAPVAVLLDSITLFAPYTAAKFGTVILHAVKPEPSLYLYSSTIVPVPPVPGVVVTVNIVPGHTDATFGFFVNPGATGCATTAQVTLLLDDVKQPVPVDVLLDSIKL